MGKIVDDLMKQGAVYTKSHFVYSGKDVNGRNYHGDKYANMREVDKTWLSSVVVPVVMRRLLKSNPDVIIGPKSLGKTLMELVSRRMGVPGVWCEIVKTEDSKQAVLPEGMGFSERLRGKKVAIVDDILNTGSTFRAVAALLEQNGATPYVSVPVVRRTSKDGVCGAYQCGTKLLYICDEIKDFEVFTAEQCAAHGPCAERVPVVVDLGHGATWATQNIWYPTQTVRS